eukprot:1982363-Pyramimonas_sp.AAC.1
MTSVTDLGPPRPPTPLASAVHRPRVTGAGGAGFRGLGFVLEVPLSGMADSQVYAPSPPAMGPPLGINYPPRGPAGCGCPTGIGRFASICPEPSRDWPPSGVYTPLARPPSRPPTSRSSWLRKPDWDWSIREYMP